jgi:phage baseplate assembly protein W
MANQSREISWPFHIGPTGGVAAVEDPAVTAYQHIVQLVMTRLGERLMRPDYGTVASQFVFENNDPVVAAELGLRLQESISRWEPGIQVISVVPSTINAASGVMQIEVSFSVPPRSDVHTTFVSVGGNLGELNG